MTRLKDIVLNARFDARGGGEFVFHENFPERYIADLIKPPKLKRKLKVVPAAATARRARSRRACSRRSAAR